MILFALLTFMSGVLLKSWVLFLVTIADLSIIAASLRGLPPDEIEVETERGSTEMNIYEEGEVWIKVKVENKGRSLRFLEIYDVIPPEVEIVEGSNRKVVDLEEGGKTVLKYKISCKTRGELEIGPSKIRYRDPLHLYYQSTTIPEKVKLHILPRAQELSRTRVRPSYTKNWLGNIRSKSIGIGSEFFSLREYVPGDELRRINWKATARQLSPITNEFEGEKSGDVILIVDGYLEGNVGTLRQNTTKASIKAASSLAADILKDRNRVGLIVLGDFLSWVYLGSGRDQYYEIMECLSKVESGGVWQLEDARSLIDNFFPSRCLIVFISPLIQEKVTETVVDMCRQEYDVMVISPNPVELEKKVLDDYEPAAKKVLDMERKNIIESLWSYGPVVDWDPTEPLEAALEEVIRYQHLK